MATPSITSKTDRSKLEPRREPYWARVRKGCYVGFRKLDSGEGTWIARWRDENDKQHYKALGHFDHFDQAAKEAETWFTQNDQGANPTASTVEAACKLYVDHLKIEKGKASAADAEGRFKRLVYVYDESKTDNTTTDEQKTRTPTIGKLDLDKLKTTHIKDWLHEQIPVDDDEDPEEIRRAKDSANRNLASLKAALNFALKHRMVATDAGWKTITPFKKVGKRRERFLSLEERNAIISACPDDLALLVKALLLTGARPGELAAATVGEFDKAQGTLTLEGKTGRRTVTLSSDAVKFFKDCAKSKIGGAYLLTRFDGAQWTKDWWKKAFAKAVKDSKVPNPDEVVLYSIRHAALSEMVAGGLDVYVVATLAGTSVAMIERHYGHLKHDRNRAKLDMVQML